MTINTSGGLSQGEIERMMRDAARHEAADKLKRDAMQLKNEADSMVYQLDNTITEHGQKASSEGNGKSFTFCVLCFDSDFGFHVCGWTLLQPRRALRML